MINILIVEDDYELRKLFHTVISEKGYNVLTATDGIEAFDVLDENQVDLVVSDVMMPRMDGFELIKNLRQTGYTMPTLLITAKDSIFDKRQGFIAGTDDYMVKPVDVNEMMWRIEALLRRSGLNSDNVITIGNTQFNGDTLVVSSKTEEVELPQKEFNLLFKLVSSKNKIFTRRQLMDYVWGVDTESDEHTLDVHISRLRVKFKNNQDFEIATVRGLGFKAVEKS